VKRISRLALSSFVASVAVQILKMHYPAMLIERGLNILLCDVDVGFPRSFYPDVKAPPFSGSTLSPSSKQV
jgi:hypothetical protein